MVHAVPLFSAGAEISRYRLIRAREAVAILKRLLLPSLVDSQPLWLLVKTVFHFGCVPVYPRSDVTRQGSGRKRKGCWVTEEKPQRDKHGDNGKMQRGRAK